MIAGPGEAQIEITALGEMWWVNAGEASLGERLVPLAKALFDIEPRDLDDFSVWVNSPDLMYYVGVVKSAVQFVITVLILATNDSAFQYS